MRCPKCHYIAFDSGERCRNCGYEFSLDVEALEPSESPELPIRMAEPMGPLADLTLQPEVPAKTRPRRRTTSGRTTASRARSARRDTAGDLPLFLDPDPVGDEPLVRSTGTPRAPLSVRRATPARVRQAEPRAPEPPPLLAGEFAADEGAFDADDAFAPDVEPAAAVDEQPDDLRPRATTGDRVSAALIDATLIGAIDIGVLYFTLRILDLPMSALLTLPPIPLLGFLALLNGGYAVAFTVAGGQTIGKMARHIQVLGANGPVTFGQAVSRTLGYVLSALPVGLGFVAAALGPDGVALHDRLAGTRVVRCHEP